MKKFATIICLLFVASINAQTIFGKWNSTNDDTGEVDSVVEVYEKDGKAFAKIIEIKDPNRQNAVCTECKGENKG